MANSGLFLAGEGPQAIGPFQELFPGNIRDPLTVPFLPKPFIEHEHKLHGRDNIRGRGAEPRPPSGAARDVAFIPHDGGVICEADLLGDGGQISADALLAAFVFVQRNIEAQATIILEPLEHAAKPLTAEGEIFGVRDVILVRIVVDIHVVGRGGHHQIHRSGRNGGGLQGIGAQDSQAIVLEENKLAHVQRFLAAATAAAVT